MNFVGVLVGGISVAYALVELLPAEVLSRPSGAPAVSMLVSLFGTEATPAVRRTVKKIFRRLREEQVAQHRTVLLAALPIATRCKTVARQNQRPAPYHLE